MGDRLQTFVFLNNKQKKLDSSLISFVRVHSQNLNYFPIASPLTTIPGPGFQSLNSGRT